MRQATSWARPRGLPPAKVHAGFSGLSHQQAGFQADRHGCRRGKALNSEAVVVRQGAHTVQVGLEVAGQVLLYHQRLFHGPIPLHHTAVLVDEELGEVPFDGIPQGAPPLGLGFHPLPQRVGIISVHTDLAVHIKLDVIASGKLFDLRVAPWLLFPKLVAGEGQDPQTALSVSGVQVDKLSVVYVCFASLRGHVGDDAHEAPVLVQVNHVPIDVLG